MDLRLALDIFNRHHPFHQDLALVASRRRTMIGTGTFDVVGKRAGLLSRRGLVHIIEGPFGREVQLTIKGNASLERSEEAFCEL